MTSTRRRSMGFIALLWLMLSAAVHASEAEALHRLFQHWQSVGLSFDGVEERNSTARPALVHGLYALYSHGEWFFTFNDAGTLWIAQDQIFVISNNRDRRANAAETVAFRAEVMRGIAWERLIRVTYGDGGGRRILELSALDCPICQNFETRVRSAGKSLDSTFYIAPTSLRQISQGAGPTWGKVAQIWCAKDTGAAWKAYWATHTVPTGEPCGWTAETAQDAINVLVSILRTVGVPDPNTTPTFIEEDGERLGRSEVSRAYGNVGSLVRTFGREGVKREVGDLGGRWLEIGAGGARGDVAPRK